MSRDEDRAWAARLLDTWESVIAAGLVSSRMELETGHRLMISLGRRDGREWWWVNVTYPGHPGVVHLHLGHDDAQVPAELARKLADPKVAREIGRMMG